MLNSLDVTYVLRPFALPQFRLHQAADGALAMQVRQPAPDPTPVREALLGLFGVQQRLTIETVDTLGDKVVQYTSDVPLPYPGAA